MAFFDDIGKKITQAGQGAVQKGKDMAEIARLNSAISEEEKKINNFYYQIGKMYAQVHRNDFDEDFSPLFFGLNESEETLAKLKADLLSVKGTQNCPFCGAEVPLNSAFCNVCGNAMPAPPVDEGKVRCSTCGNMINRGLKFCTKCGSLVEYAPVQEAYQEADPQQYAQAPQQYAPQDPLQYAPQAPQQYAPQAPQGRICPSCGFANEDDVAFCIECGSKI